MPLTRYCRRLRVCSKCLRLFSRSIYGFRVVLASAMVPRDVKCPLLVTVESCQAHQQRKAKAVLHDKCIRYSLSVTLPYGWVGSLFILAVLVDLSASKPSPITETTPSYIHSSKFYDALYCLFLPKTARNFRRKAQPQRNIGQSHNIHTRIVSPCPLSVFHLAIFTFPRNLWKTRHLSGDECESTAKPLVVADV